jgi:hypothetical protein
VYLPQEALLVSDVFQHVKQTCAPNRLRNDFEVLEGAANNGAETPIPRIVGAFGTRFEQHDINASLFDGARNEAVTSADVEQWSRRREEFEQFEYGAIAMPEPEGLLLHLQAQGMATGGIGYLAVVPSEPDT